MVGLTFEKVNRLVSDQVARQILGCVHTAHDQCAVAIGTFPQFNEIGLLGALFKLDRATYHCDCISRIIICTRTSKAFDGLLCLGQTALSYKPPGRFRRNVEQDSERSRKHPLERNGNSGMRVSIVLLDRIYGSGRTCTPRSCPWIGSGK